MDSEQLCVSIWSALGDSTPLGVQYANATFVQNQNNSLFYNSTTAETFSAMETTDATTNTRDIQLLEVLVEWTMPVICIFGAIGNLLNLVVLSLRIREGTELMEKGVLYGLIGLALSDLLFCVVTLPWSFIDNHGIVYLERGFQYYYAIASEPLQNILMKTSTWLTVIMSLSRYFAVCHPLKARQYANPRYTLIAIVCSAATCIVIHIPFIWTWTTDVMSCSYGPVYMLNSGPFTANQMFRKTFTYTWAVLGFFVPLAIMAYCNVKLIMSLRLSARLRQESKVPTKCQNRDGQRRISITLIAIVAMFFILICPSEIVHFYSEVAGPTTENMQKLDIALNITNILQTLNFALNFVLYCAVNVHFRKTVRRLLFVYVLCGLFGHHSKPERTLSVKSTRVSLLSRQNVTAV